MKKNISLNAADLLATKTNIRAGRTECDKK